MHPVLFSQEPDLKKLTKGNGIFCFDLYKKIKIKQGNLFISPYSISTALSMTYAGARGATAEEISKVMHFDLAGAEINKDFRDLTDSLSDTGCQLNIANALWLQKGEALLPDYVSLVDKFYEGRLNIVDFRGATEEVRSTINSWVEEKTQDKIKELLRSGDIDAATMLVLTNAIYFKGFWLSKFDNALTKEEPFDTALGAKVNTPMMHIEKDFNYAEDGDMQVLALPYRGSRLEMLVFLPKDKSKIARIEAELDYLTFEAWLSKLNDEKVSVALPKFKFNSRYMLADTLKEMGMTSVFSGGADFSGITGKNNIFIDKIIHQAFVEVNEEGTEAAAATAVTMTRGAMITPKEPKVFIADHPFIFIIYDKGTSSILFIGKVDDPSQA